MAEKRERPMVASLLTQSVQQYDAIREAEKKAEPMQLTPPSEHVEHAPALVLVHEDGSTEIVPWPTGEQILEARQMTGLNQLQMAEGVMSQSMIGRWERSRGPLFESNVALLMKLLNKLYRLGVRMDADGTVKPVIED